MRQTEKPNHHIYIYQTTCLKICFGSNDDHTGLYLFLSVIKLHTAIQQNSMIYEFDQAFSDVKLHTQGLINGYNLNVYKAMYYENQ